MKKNNRKMKISKNKLIIIISVVVLLVIVVTGVAILANKINNKQKEENKNEGTPAVSIDKQTINTLYNNFLIAYILQGDVQTGSGTLTIEGDSNVYYAVTDPLFENIHTLADIKELINDNLLDYITIRVDKLMNSEYANQYTSTENTLYVKKTINTCSVSPFGNLEKERIEYSKREDKNFAVYERVPYEAVTDEDGSLKASAMWFGCSQAINYTDIDKDSTYDPYKQYTSAPSEEDENNEENGEN